ncbi:O-antigen ligase family protein [Arthrobacter sp. SRS-W-1-2016]|jgi:hypothetical protein|uniref:O-antigen ligase family protein n=1 Tax=Arthrobacter sp. SRS-W-1-2016 TaxID=1930254 RepID=UPI0015C56954|nr:O-antigen ligase family protein [Arthrobacter sp. SRS-W-1-2016]
METLLIVALCILGVVVLGTLRNGRAALSLLVGASAGLVAVQVFRVHVFTILVIAWALYKGGTHNPKSAIRIVLIAIPVALMAFTSVVGDLVNSDTLVYQLIGLAASSALIIALSTKEDRRQMLGGLLAMVTLSSIVGVLQVLKIVPLDPWHLSVSALGRPIGLYPEPDWLGMFAGVGAVMAWRIPMRRSLRVLAVSVNSAAFILAFARAAWIAVAVGVAVVIVTSWFARKREKDHQSTRGRAAAVGVIAAATVCVFMFVPTLVNNLATRLSQTLQVSGDDISGQARVRQFDSLMRLADMAPFYGHGLSASGRVGVWGDIISGVASSNNVASNWILAMWVDGKYLAVPFIMLFTFVAMKSMRTIEGQALLIVLVSSLFSNATFFPVTWMLLALAMMPGSTATTPLIVNQLPNGTKYAGNQNARNGNHRTKVVQDAMHRNAPAISPAQVDGTTNAASSSLLPS